MPLIGHKPDARDLIDIADIQLGQQGPLLDSIYDPTSKDYRPDLIPTDPDTGQPLMDSIYDPESPNYRPDLEPNRKTLGDVAVDDWIFTKAGEYLTRKKFAEDPNFEKPWNELTPQYDEYAGDFAATRSQDEWDYLRHTIDKSFANHKFMETADAGDMAGYMGIQLLDPALLPLYFVNLVKLGKAGTSLASSAGKMGAYAAGEGAAIEAVLQGTDPTRTAAQSLATIAGAGVMGSLFGVAGQGLVNTLGKKQAATIQDEIVSLLETDIKTKFRRPINETESIGAGSSKTTLADEKPVRNPVKAIMLRSPTMRLAYDNVSAAASRAIDRLVPHNILKNKHLKGIASEDTPLYSSIMQVREQNVASMVNGIRETRKALRDRGVKFSEDEIATMVGRAARRGDEDPNYPEITRLSKQFRDIVDEWGERAHEVGLLTLVDQEALDAIEKSIAKTQKEISEIEQRMGKSADDVTEEALGLDLNRKNKRLKEKQQELKEFQRSIRTQGNYYPRIYDTRKISRKFQEWTNVLGRHFRKENPDLTDGEIEEIASSIHKTLMGDGFGKAWIGGFKVPPKVAKSGHFKGRRLDIDDVEIEAFLVDDVRYVTQHYFRSAAPGVLAREMFGADNIAQTVDGKPYIKSILEEMEAEYDFAKMHLKDKGKSTESIDKEWRRAKNDMIYVMSSVMGYHNPTVSYMRGFGQVASQELRAYTGAMALGNLVLSAIPDMANLILSHGLANLIKSAPAILRPRKWSNSAKVDFDSLAIGIDTIMSTRMLRMADLEERHLNAFTRGIGGQQTATFAFKYFGANLWNSWMKRAAGTASMNRILTDVARYDKLGKARKARLAQLGIDKDVAESFATQYAKQTQKKRQGVRWADLDNWDDVTASKFERIMFRDVETTVVTPQAGDMPKVLDNEVGLLLAQFKRFVMSHQLQIMTQASQRLATGDLAVLNYIVAGAGLGMLSHYLRTQAKHGFDQEKVDEAMSEMTPQDWIFHAVDRGAMLSFGTDMLMGINGLTDGATGQMLGFSDSGRYQMSGLGLEQKVPGLGTLSRVARLGDAVADQVVGAGDFNQKDLHNARQLVPLQNTFYLAWLFDQLEESTAEELGLPKNSRASKIRN